MKTIAVFNNKGGVGKTTLTYHLAAALAELGHRTLLLDLDPQSNLTLFGFSPDDLYGVWRTEDAFIDDFEDARRQTTPEQFRELLAATRSVHFLLKPTEDGAAEPDELATPASLFPHLDLVPGRLTVHMYENKIGSRWSDAYQGDPQAIKTILRIRQLCNEYAERRGYEFVVMDTSPSLGVLNKTIISTADAFLVPCAPDMFSLYGIRNIGSALQIWKREFDTMHKLLSDQKRKQFPSRFVQFLGFTIYNAKRYADRNEWDLAQAHYNYARQIPPTIEGHIPDDARTAVPKDLIAQPIGGKNVMHTHNTAPAMSQMYRCPIWRVPSLGSRLEPTDRQTILGNRKGYEQTQAAYHGFATDLLRRVALLN